MKNQEKVESDCTAKRRCIGRKALTDFEIGKKYTGTIVYIKPTLGLFIDINCHSDAFCHISRCTDGYVETISDEIYKVGDVLEDKVRVVNIDRKNKKITASLQMDARMEDEEKANESWRQIRAKKKAKKKNKLGEKRRNHDSDSGKNHTTFEEERTSNYDNIHILEKNIEETFEEQPIIYESSRTQTCTEIAEES